MSRSRSAITAGILVTSGTFVGDVGFTVKHNNCGNEVESIYRRGTRQDPLCLTVPIACLHMT